MKKSKIILSSIALSLCFLFCSGCVLLNLLNFKTPEEILAGLPDNYTITMQHSSVNGDQTNTMTLKEFKCEDGLMILDGENEASGFACIVNNDVTTYYKLSLENNVKTKKVITAEEFDYEEASPMALYAVTFSLLSLLMENGGSAKLLDMNCTKYNYTLEEATGEYYIERKYSICLKFINYENGIEQDRMEVTNFKIGTTKLSDFGLDQYVLAESNPPQTL